MATDKLHGQLVLAADAAQQQLAAPSPTPRPATALPRMKLQAAATTPQPPAHSCQQTLTLSFFFDGTGNNLEADVATAEHSNVARLYRAHVLDNESVGIYSFYLPGIGTYFMDREVQDSGGRLDGNGFGRLGQQRLDFAFARLREKLAQAEARAENPTNKICWIKISAFGFSRGAALARAFCRDLQALCRADAASSTGWRLRQGGHPVNISFLGLFDTVASAGLPPSANNLQRNRFVQAIGMLTNPVATAARALLLTPELKQLAFGNAPGADPAPGTFDGHGGWANGLAVVSMVKRAYHIMAAHEIRNSFALDTALYLQRVDRTPTLITHVFGPPDTCTEVLFPGVHSDVGGGYRPGEGGCKPERGAQLSLVALRVMHQQAVDAGVPLRQLAAFEDDQQREDFAIDAAGAPHFAAMAGIFNHYVNFASRYTIQGATQGLGNSINQHMRAYYAWRFRCIRQPRVAGTNASQQQVNTAEQGFAQDRARIAEELTQARRDLFQAQRREETARSQLQSAQMAEQRYGIEPRPTVAENAQRHQLARRETERRQIAVDRLRARADGAANDSELNAAITQYDRMLLEDARNIVAWMRDDRSLRLRPHYYALVEAYLDEYERGRGLTDPRVIEFFDDYVHDSLAGFNTDETWPSDPRILYVGGDNRLRYAATPPTMEPGRSIAA